MRLNTQLINHWNCCKITVGGSAEKYNMTWLVVCWTSMSQLPQLVQDYKPIPLPFYLKYTITGGGRVPKFSADQPPNC